MVLQLHTSQGSPPSAPSFNMADTEKATKRHSGPLLLFGPIPLSFDAPTLNILHETVVEHAGNDWLIELIRTLPQTCETALSRLPSSYQAAGRLVSQQLTEVTTAFTLARPLDSITFPLPNTILIPLGVVTQLVQYAEFTQQTSFGEIREALGLCTGLLSAFAVASAHDNSELRRYGAAAVRLGLLAGLVVDCENQASSSARRRCLSTAWSSGEKQEEMMRMIKESSEVGHRPTLLLPPPADRCSSGVYLGSLRQEPCHHHRQRR